MSRTPNPLPTLAPRPTYTSTEFLRRISNMAIDVLNSHDFNHTSGPGRELLSHFAPGVEGRLDNYPDPINLIQLNQICALWPILQPNVRFDIEDLEVICDEEAGTGTVFITVGVSGLTEEVNLKGFLELKWGREGNGPWLIRSFHGMRQGLNAPPSGPF